MFKLSNGRGNDKNTATGAHPSSSHVLTLKSLKGRSGFEIAGVFILLALILAIAAAETGGSKPAVHNANSTQPDASSTSSSEPQVNSNASNLSTTQNSSASSDQNSGSDSSVSTNVSSSTDSNGHTSTSVTVNGQSVSVPSNGSVHKRVGNTEVDATGVHNGTSSNLNVSSTNLDINSSSESDISTGGNN
ncbi:MAG TPA: hypothetical protein VLG27_00635 [Candidatus Saccharimonadia bacterium]|nr:hypothetical protein [Candidatus Saccharimonadia bacterium]